MDYELVGCFWLMELVVVGTVKKFKEYFVLL